MRKLPSPSKFLSPLVYNNFSPRLQVDSQTGGRDCTPSIRQSLKARVEFNEVYFREEFPNLRCTRWHIALRNGGPTDAIVTGWEVVTYRNLFQRLWGQPKVLRSEVHDPIRLLPPQPDYPGRRIAPNTSIQIFVVSEPDVDLVRHCRAYLRIRYEGGAERVRLQYLR